MTMPETLKPDELVRDIFEVANQLGGYIGPDTPDHLAAFLKRESDEAAKLAYRIVALQSELERVTAERDTLRSKLFPYADETDISGMSWGGFYLIGNTKSIKELKRIEHRAAQLDQFCAAYEESVARERARALTAEAALVKARKALEPFAKAADDAEKHAGWDGPRGDFISYEVLRAARLALSAGEEENGR